LYEEFAFEMFDDFELVALPEPRKTWYENAKTYKEVNESIVNGIDKFVDSLPEKTKPRIVRKSAFNPSGEALKKSKRNPDTNPVLSANKEPLFNAIKRVIINKKSGTAGR
jgi:hypothetical protein